MKKAPMPWFAFYPEKFLGGVAHFTNEEAGIYIKLMCHQWLRGVPRDRVPVLVGQCYSPRSIPTVLKKFCKKGPKIVNNRLEQERKVSDQFREKQSAKAKARWGCRSNAPAYAGGIPQIQSNNQTKKHLIDYKVDYQDNQIIKKGEIPPSEFLALKLANQIISNKSGWNYDNHKVSPADLQSQSLKTVILPFTGLLKERQIMTAWDAAALTAHQATVDGLAVNPPAYAVQCFKQQLESKGKGPNENDRPHL